MPETSWDETGPQDLIQSQVLFHKSGIKFVFILE